MWCSHRSQRFVGIKARGIAGEWQILSSAMPRAAFYEAEDTFAPVNGTRTMAPAFDSKRGVALTGLPREKDYFVRVRSVATAANLGLWNGIANVMAM